MPDITMCSGTGCPIKSTCYRYRAKPSEYGQSYFMGVPIKDGKCEYYWKLDNFTLPLVLTDTLT
jgi:hypothetical protein